MSKINNPMEIYKLLDKSNCRQCSEATCLAFAAAVFRGQKKLDQCPRLDPGIVARFADGASVREEIKRDQDKVLQRLQGRIAAVDLARAAERLGGRHADGKLTLKILGKDFSVDDKGRLSSDIHIHSWIAVPVLSHILEGAGRRLTGQWVSFRELQNGRARYPLFEQRCEKALQKVADRYPDLFEDMIHIFNGRQVDNHYASDISLVLRPLPLVPVLICYWKPDDGLASTLNLFFDASVEYNLSIEALFALTAGLVTMFEKLALRHGIQ